MNKVLALFGALALAGAASASQVTLSFGELAANTDVGAGVTVQGVTLSFTGGTATYNFSTGLLDADTTATFSSFLSDPVLEGDTAGTLTLQFAAPTSLLQFSFALVTTDPVTNAAQVTLTGPGFGVPGVINVDTTTPVVVSEAQFSNSGPLISQAVITFNTGVSQFALDNLTFEVPDGGGAVPEPGSLPLILSGSLLIGLVTGARRFCRPRA